MNPRVIVADLRRLFEPNRKRIRADELRCPEPKCLARLADVAPDYEFGPRDEHVHGMFSEDVSVTCARGHRIHLRWWVDKEGRAVVEMEVVRSET